MLTARTSNHHHAAWGLAGGGSPPPSRTFIILPDGTREEMDILETREIVAGSRVCLSLSGGGYGHPYERAMEKVCVDVLNGYVTR